MYTSMIENENDIIFAELLPHGSGINCAWGACRTKDGRTVAFVNSFDCISKDGSYEGYQNFTVKVPALLVDEIVLRVRRAEWRRKDAAAEAVTLLKVAAESFSLHFNGNRHLSEKHMLRDYLEKRIAYKLESPNVPSLIIA